MMLQDNDEKMDVLSFNLKEESKNNSAKINN